MLKIVDSAAHLAKARASSKASQPVDAGDDVGDEDFKPLSREQAEKFRQANPSVSSWAVLAGQLVVGVLVACAAWGLTGRQNVGWSALYGALAVVIPGALFLRGLGIKVSLLNPGAAVAGFFLWEMVKIGLTIAMLFTAPRWVPDLSWPAMLVGLVVTMKVVWLLLLLRSRSNRQTLIKRVD